MEACGMAPMCYWTKKYIFCIKLEACPYCTSSNSHVNSAYLFYKVCPYLTKPV